METLHTPEKLLELRQGDCDDKSLLLLGLLESLGHTARFKAVGFMRGFFSHVLVEVLIDGQWVSAETTEPVPLGWGPPNVADVLYG